MPSISHRVKTLELRLSSFASLETLFAHRMESLETLNVSAMGGSQQTIESLTHEVDLAVIAPRLTVVMLGDNYPDMSTIPWGRLTVLHLSDAPTHCLDLFLQCANLKEASLFTGEWPDLANVPDRPVTLLPHLRSLQFVMDYGDDWDADGGHAEQFLQPLALPALTSLQLSLGGRPLSSAQISPFLLRSPNIQDLDLVLSEISSEDLVGVLRSTPALTYLRLCMCFTCIDDSSLGALQYRENDADPLVPLLEHLHWDNILGVFEGASLEAMLRSRWWPAGLQSPYAAQSSPRVARLGNIYMSFQSGMNLDINGLKAKMQDCGDDSLYLWPLIHIFFPASDVTIRSRSVGICEHAV
ncbi:hypothetical protein B0H11DRAFT_2280442 [Mycena galericulata]|nr:hypothetical protein B0H11DRAFT_2280442 [Mycena galericulata]